MDAIARGGHLASELLNLKPEPATSWAAKFSHSGIAASGAGPASKVEKLATRWLIFHGLTPARHFELALIICQMTKLKSRFSPRLT